MLRTIMLGFFVVFSLAACGNRASQQENESDIQITVTAEQTKVGDTMLSIELLDAQGAPIDDAHIEIKGDMNHAGMTPVLVSADAGKDGRYTVPFEWTMAGDWIVSVDVVLTDGATASQQFDFTIGVDSGGMDMDSEMDMESHN